MTPHILALIAPHTPQGYRAIIRPLYDAFLKSSPAGPYEVKIPPEHKAFGEAGSRRGM